MPRVTYFHIDPRVTLDDPVLGFAEVQQTVLFSIAACGKRAQGRSQLPKGGSPSGSKAHCHIHQGALDAAVDVVALREFGQSREQDTQLSP
jgi:hypothetical protein